MGGETFCSGFAFCGLLFGRNFVKHVEGTLRLGNYFKARMGDGDNLELKLNTLVTLFHNKHQVDENWIAFLGIAKLFVHLLEILVDTHLPVLEFFNLEDHRFDLFYEESWKLA